MTGLLIIDKPSDMTSQTVVNIVKRACNVKKAGHGGTLDPLATGVLPVMIGSAVGASDYIMSHDKHYLAGIEFGYTTDTQDVTGKKLSQYDGELPDFDAFCDACRHFVGRILQTPPMYSALKVGGQKLCDLARSGVSIERQSREITVESIIPSCTEGAFYLDVKCSKGTYIRTLCEDIGAYLGCGAVMSSLRRLSAGRFDIADAITLDALKEMSPSQIEQKLIKPEDLFDFDTIRLSGEIASLFCNGVHLGFERNSLGEYSAGQTYKVFVDGAFKALGECVLHDGVPSLKVKKFF